MQCSRDLSFVEESFSNGLVRRPKPYIDRATLHCNVQKLTTVKCINIDCSVMQYRAKHGSTVQLHSVQHSAKQVSAAQCSAAQCNAGEIYHLSGKLFLNSLVKGSVRKKKKF